MTWAFLASKLQQESANCAARYKLLVKSALEKA